MPWVEGASPVPAGDGAWLKTSKVTVLLAGSGVRVARINGPAWVRTMGCLVADLVPVAIPLKTPPGANIPPVGGAGRVPAPAAVIA